MIDDAKEEIDTISAGLGDAQDAAAAASRDVVHARAELDTLDVDIAEQSALGGMLLSADAVADVVERELAAFPDAVVTDVASVKLEPLHALRARQTSNHAFSAGARGHAALLAALPPRYAEVLLALLDRLLHRAMKR